MVLQLHAVVEGGELKSLEPIPLPDGTRVDGELVVTGEPGPTRAERFRRALEAWNEAASEYSEEWWDDFERDLQANRFNIEERE